MPSVAHPYESRPISLLPSQLATRPGIGRIPEVRLLIAILEDALQCIARSAAARTGGRRRQFHDAYAWVFEEPAAEWPFAFENVCGVLGLDATAVRLRVREVFMPSGSPRSVWAKRFPIVRFARADCAGDENTISSAASQ